MFRNLSRLVIVVSIVFQACSTKSASENSQENSSSAQELITLPAPKINVVAQEQTEAYIVFEKTKHDFGKVYHGEKLEYTFFFTNKGQDNLVIYSSNASCGCTVPEFEKQPIPPGKQGRIKIVFDTKGFRGLQNKSISVVSNASNNYVLLIVSANIII